MSPDQLMMLLAIVILLVLCVAIKKEMDRHGK